MDQARHSGRVPLKSYEFARAAKSLWIPPGMWLDLVYLGDLQYSLVIHKRMADGTVMKCEQPFKDSGVAASGAAVRVKKLVGQLVVDIAEKEFRFRNSDRSERWTFGLTPAPNHEMVV